MVLIAAGLFTGRLAYWTTGLLESGLSEGGFARAGVPEDWFAGKLICWRDGFLEGNLLTFGF